MHFSAFASCFSFSRTGLRYNGFFGSSKACYILRKRSQGEERPKLRLVLERRQCASFQQPFTISTGPIPPFCCSVLSLIPTTAVLLRPAMLLAPIAALFMTMHTSPASATALATTVDPSALDITAKVSAAPVCSDGDHRSLTFAVVGDWGRKGKWHQQEVADVMSRVCGLRTCDFVVSVGYDVGGQT
mmetsp:Transcript_2308/g.4085  ORF Transcript_2308/g.4085 Transcript_2308/m.4085 type:complete len:187 (+) Transcript_2308:1-561(+)